MTDRVLRTLECPWVDILGHPTGRKLLKRPPTSLDVARVAEVAARLGVALEINAQASRLDLSDAHARMALGRGARLVVSSDAHSASGLHNLRWGIQVARRAWATAGDVLNTLPIDAMRAGLRRAGGAARH